MMPFRVSPKKDDTQNEVPFWIHP